MLGLRQLQTSRKNLSCIEIENQFNQDLGNPAKRKESKRQEKIGREKKRGKRESRRENKSEQMCCRNEDEERLVWNR